MPQYAGDAREKAVIIAAVPYFLRRENLLAYKHFTS